MSKRNQHILPPLLNRSIIRKIGITCFMAFIAFRILTPPQKNLFQDAPNGSQQARLKIFYYTQDIPSYKIYTRPNGTLLWKNQLYLPAYTNTPNPTATLKWSHDSQRLDLLINQTSIWHTTTF
ncbi:MAG: hypothetical protein CBE26_00375 [Kiritimatiellaceae bacterium TMED266]|nr:MAG: hypothetical protein CBE26_00375 [Kiritimatiellaceae bacterium TMED266]